MPSIKTSFHSLFKLFFQVWFHNPLEDAKSELLATERDLLQAESVLEDYQSRVPLLRKRIARLRGYVNDYEESSGVKLPDELSGLDVRNESPQGLAVERRAFPRHLPYPSIEEVPDSLAGNASHGAGTKKTHVPQSHSRLAQRIHGTRQ